eukprot:7028674-Ditylum_brightwellii.AAC.1
MTPYAVNGRGKCKGPPMRCSLCACTDHQHRSSKKCPHYKGKEMSRSSTTEGEAMGVATNNGGVASNDDNVAEKSAITSIAAIANTS